MAMHYPRAMSVPMEAHDAALFDGIMSEVESFVLAGDLECALETLRMAERINPKDGVLRRKIAEVNQLAGLAPVPTVEAAVAATKAAQHRFAHLVAVGKYAPPRTTLSAAERRTRGAAVSRTPAADADGRCRGDGCAHRVRWCARRGDPCLAGAP